jgi:2-polyprenyl-6-methoxyphenol hydroxylase-like FAD-dependent oxidoreductase
MRKAKKVEWQRMKVARKIVEGVGFRWKFPAHRIIIPINENNNTAGFVLLSLFSSATNCDHSSTNMTANTNTTLHNGNVEAPSGNKKSHSQHHNDNNSNTHQRRFWGTKGGNNKCSKNERKRKRRLDPSTSKVVVVGAGLAGLSAALSLKRAGFTNVQVYERDPSLGHQKEGYGLTLTYNPKGPLADLGVLETVATMDCPSRSHYLFKQQDEQDPHTVKNGDKHTPNDTAVPMGYFGNAFFDGTSAFRRGYGQRGNLRVPRKVLRKILHDALLENQPTPQQQEQEQAVEDNTGNLDEKAAPTTPSVHWNSSLVDFKWDSSAQQYHVRFEAAKIENDNNTTKEANNPKTTTTVVADLLVAADGIRSSVLQQLYNRKLRENDEEEETVSAAPTTTKPLSTPIIIPSIRDFPERYGLRPMGIRLILGIADGIDHPLLRERGFYTVDTHGHRLFTMPYRSNRFDNTNNDEDNNNNNNNESGANNSKKTTSQNRIMWQLSFSTPINPKTLDPASLRKYVLDIFQSWHPPVLDLVKSTPPSGIWGTDLMDRDPRQVYRELIVGDGREGGGTMVQQPRLAICGDALHSMSPFKGQGANQALADGPLLARWLSKSSIDAALTNWWREVLNRTAPVVEASRKAARDWHDPKRILETCKESHQEYHGFAGVQASALSSLVETLKERRIGPHLGADLDQTIRDLISEHGWFDNDDSTTSGNEKEQQPHEQQRISLEPGLCEMVLKLAADGDTAALRKMSLPSSSSGGDTHHRSCFAMVEARDSNGRSCLHLAAKGNHIHVCKWLLAELRILELWDSNDSSKAGASNCSSSSNTISNDCGPRDKLGKTSLDYAMETGSKELIRLFEVVLRDSKTSKS